MITLDFIGDSPFSDFQKRVAAQCDTLFGSFGQSIPTSQLLWAAKKPKIYRPEGQGIWPFGGGIAAFCGQYSALVFSSCCGRVQGRMPRLSQSIRKT